MDDREIMECIHGLAADEHWLREQRATGALSEDVEMRRMAELEDSLDQLWDALRRRRALRSAGFDPDVAEQREQLVRSGAR